MNDFEKKESILFKKLDLAFVYLFIFIVGIIIIFIMISYINNQVKEIDNGYDILTIMK